jgi:hypothetical protein
MPDGRTTSIDQAAIMSILNGGTRPRLRPEADDTEPVVRVRPWPQLSIVVAAIAAYFLVRGATQAATAEALGNAHRVVGWERALGLYHEPAWQASVMNASWVRTALNGMYIWGHWPVIVLTLGWLAFRHPAVYLRARNAMLLSGGIGLVVFASFPVAPPRLAGLGMTDTVTVGVHAYRVLQPPMFTNQYAAMPSLHVGWDLVIGLAIATATRHLVLRVLAMALPIAMVTAVLFTANHYVLDAVAGATLTTVCWLIVGRRARRGSVPPPPARPSVVAAVHHDDLSPVPVPVAALPVAAAVR